MIESNSTFVARLKDMVSDDDLRHRLIYSSVVFGVYMTRKLYSAETGRTLGDFELGIVTSQVYGAKTISGILERVVGEIEGSRDLIKGANESLNSLKEDISKIRFCSGNDIHYNKLCLTEKYWASMGRKVEIALSQEIRTRREDVLEEYFFIEYSRIFGDFSVSGEDPNRRGALDSETFQDEDSF